MDLHKENKIALLIDGDNAHSKFIESMLTEAGKNGKVTIRRIYGDWTGFDTRTYGYATLTELFKSMPDFFNSFIKTMAPHCLSASKNKIPMPLF